MDEIGGPIDRVDDECGGGRQLRGASDKCFLADELEVGVGGREAGRDHLLHSLIGFRDEIGSYVVLKNSNKAGEWIVLFFFVPDAACVGVALMIIWPASLATLTRRS
jgi:hypothetical protein